MFERIIETAPDKAVILIRKMVGIEFLFEGIHRFLFPENLGVGRFRKIGLPNPEFLSPFVGTFEIMCGTLPLLGLLTQQTAIPLIVIMLVALATTKVEILTNKGFWTMMH